MLSRYGVLLILVASIAEFVVTGDANYLDKVVKVCVAESANFARTEEKYAVKNPPKDDEPLMVPPQNTRLQLRTYEIEKCQRPFECITNQLKGVTHQQLLSRSAQYKKLVQQCEAARPDPECDFSSPYSTIDGTCNNMHHPAWGSVLSCARRLLPANYEGAADFRKSVVDCLPLPDPRDMTLEFLTDMNRNTTKYNALSVSFGQLVAHDITEYSFSLIKDKMIDCCSDPNGKDQHPQCAALLLSQDDPYYSTRNVSCFNFVRRALCDTCSVGTRMPMNKPTSYIDLSFAYGYYEDMARDLRVNDARSGKLKTQWTSVGELLPAVKTTVSRCGEAKKGEFCFYAGDDRLNQQTPLIMLQTLFVREHNRIAGILKDLNGHWDGEKLFQEARKINIAQYQMIVYNELLSILLGKELLSKFKLRIDDDTKYDPRLNAAISVEFNVAAYRLHSIIPSKFVHNGGAGYFSSYLRDLFVNAKPLYRGWMSSFLYQMSSTVAQQYDQHVVSDMTNFLYKKPGARYGFDMVALNIQRGRETGLPTYVQVVDFIRGRKISCFEDLCDYMEPKCVEGLRQIYRDVADIDLWVGLNCEKHLKGGILGKTASIIIAEQFYRLKCGDRFYFEYNDNFTPAQLRTLLNASLAKIICDNTNVPRLPKRTLEFPSKKNPVVECCDFPAVNLEMWKEECK